MSHKLTPVQLAKLKQVIDENNPELRSSSLEPNPVWKQNHPEQLKRKEYNPLSFMDDYIEGTNYDPLEYLNR